VLRAAGFGELAAIAACAAICAGASDNSSSPVSGFTWCACIGGNGSIGGGWLMTSTRMSWAATASRRRVSSVSNRLKASDLYSFSGSRWP
jgi:hypothetical protein